MIKHTVQPGDLLGVLAVRYKTTMRILMSDNPFIPKSQKLKPGWRLNIYTPEENAKRHSETAYAQIEAAHDLKDEIFDSEYMTKIPKKPVPYKDRLILDGQVGFAKTKAEVPLYSFQSNGYHKKIRILPKGSIMRVYENVFHDGDEYFLVDDYHWITSDRDKVFYEPVPQQDLDGKIRLNSQPEMKSFQSFGIQSLGSLQSLTASASSASLIKPKTTIGYGPKPSGSSYKVPPRSFIGAGTPKDYKDNDGLSSIPLFETPTYKRPILRMKNAAGESKTVEMRVLGFSANYGNRVQPTNTNAGWMINVRAHDLPTLTISGFLMETKANDEFNDFMTRYHKYLKARKFENFYGLGISTLYYKRTEYRGIFVGFNFTDRSEERLHRKYNLQMMVLKEKNLSSSEVRAIKPVVSRRGMSEELFRSDIGAMLANPVTGNYFTDFF